MGRRARHYRVARLRVFKGEIVGLVKPGDENIRRFGIGRDARAVDGEKRVLTTTARKPPLRTDTLLGFLGELLQQSLRCGGQSAQNLVRSAQKKQSAFVDPHLLNVNEPGNPAHRMRPDGQEYMTVLSRQGSSILYRTIQKASHDQIRTRHAR